MKRLWERIERIMVVAPLAGAMFEGAVLRTGAMKGLQAPCSVRLPCPALPKDNKKGNL